MRDRPRQAVYRDRLVDGEYSGSIGPGLTMGVLPWSHQDQGYALECARYAWEDFATSHGHDIAFHPPDRATPARALRLRLHLDPVSGPSWLTLLGLYAYLRGVLVVQGPQSVPST